MHVSTCVPEASIPLPAPLAAVWGGFLFDGLFIQSHSEVRSHEILACWGQGCVELVTAACTVLPALWRQAAARWEAEDADFPGVFEYEVVATLGGWLGDFLLGHEGNMPDPVEVSRQISAELDQFFLRGRDDGAGDGSVMGAHSRQVA